MSYSSGSLGQYVATKVAFTAPLSLLPSDPNAWRALAKTTATAAANAVSLVPESERLRTTRATAWAALQRRLVANAINSATMTKEALLLTLWTGLPAGIPPVGVLGQYASPTQIRFYEERVAAAPFIEAVRVKYNALVRILNPALAAAEAKAVADAAAAAAAVTKALADAATAKAAADLQAARDQQSAQEAAARLAAANQVAQQAAADKAAADQQAAQARSAQLAEAARTAPPGTEVQCTDGYFRDAAGLCVPGAAPPGQQAQPDAQQIANDPAVPFTPFTSPATVATPAAPSAGPMGISLKWWAIGAAGAAVVGYMMMGRKVTANSRRRRHSKRRSSNRRGVRRNIGYVVSGTRVHGRNGTGTVVEVHGENAQIRWDSGRTQPKWVKRASLDRL
jgi:hypothetical protein